MEPTALPYATSAWEYQKTSKSPIPSPSRCLPKQPGIQGLKALLNPGGQILIDSSDLKYIYENEDGSFDINLNGAYYGEVDYQMIYKDVKGDRFDWLYVDFPLLKSIAETCGLHGELVAEGEHYDYLARIF